MKRKLKKTTIDLYKSIVEFIESVGVADTKMIYEEMDKNSKRIGIDITSRKKALLEQFKFLLGSSTLEVTKDGKYNNYLNEVFSLKGNKEEIYKLLEEGKRNDSSSKKEEKGTKVYISSLKNILGIADHMISKRRNNMSYEEINSVIDRKSPCDSIYINSLNNTLKKCNLKGEFIIDNSDNNDGRKKGITLIGVTPVILRKDLIAEINLKSNGEEKIEMKDELEKAHPTTTIKEIFVENKDFKSGGYLIFALGGILNNLGKAMSIDGACRILRENFGISTDRKDLEEVVKKEPDLELVNFGSAIKLKDRESWARLKEYYDPRQFRKTVMARIGMSLSEVREFFPKSELISKISDNDGIYNIIYSESRSDWKNLVRLFRTFRGTDVILDNEVQKRLTLAVMSENILVCKHDIAYEIEQ